MLFILFTGCAEPPAPEPPPIVNVPTDQPTTKDAKDDFEMVCGRLRELRCKEGQNTPKGNTCETVLRNAMQEGIDLVGDVDCTVSATSCQYIRDNCE